MNIHSENQLVKEILYMVINAGEQDFYRQQVKSKVNVLSIQFDGKISHVRKYIEALLTIEVYEHPDAYPNPEQAIRHLHLTLMGCING